MKSILILRHAKSDWNNPSLSDFDRPLNKRGLKDAPRMGQVLKTANIMPDLILSSPSMRTKSTVELAMPEGIYRGEISWIDSLYGGSFYDILNALHSVPESFSRPMIVGHNPGVEETISLLLSPQEQSPSTHARIRVPTAGLAYLDAHVDTWPDDGERIDHGSMFLRALKEGLIVPERSVQIGIRSFSDDEYPHAWRGAVICFVVGYGLLVGIGRFLNTKKSANFLHRT